MNKKGLELRNQSGLAPQFAPEFSDLLLLPRQLLLVVLTLAIAAAGALLVVEQLLLAVAVVLILLVGAAILIWPHTATLAVIFLLFSNAAAVAVRFHNVPYILGASVPLLLAIPLGHYLIVRREQIIINQAMLLLLLFLAVQTLGVLLARGATTAVDGLLGFAIEGFLLYFLTVNAIRSERVLRLAVWAMVIAGLLMGGLSFYQQVTGTFDNNYGGFAQTNDPEFGSAQEVSGSETGQPRLSGPIGFKNRYAQLMLMLMPLALFRMWGEPSRWWRGVAAVATGFIIIGATLAFSRGAAVAFVLLILIMISLRYIKLKHLVVIVIAGLLVLQAFPHYTTRLSSLQALSQLFADEDSEGIAGADGSTRSRLTEMAAAGLVFMDYPILGVGPGMYPQYYPEYAAKVGIRVKPANREAHSLYLGLAAEHGLAGLVTFGLILWVTLRDLAQVRRRFLKSRPELANLATAFLLAIVSYLMTGIFLHFALIRFFWLTMALAAALSYVAEKKSNLRGIDA